MMKYMVACAFGMCLSAMCVSSGSAAPAITVKSVNSVKNQLFVNVTVTANVSGGAALTKYQWRIVAVRCGNSTVVNASSPLTTLADGTAALSFTGNTTLAFGTTYDFKVSLFNDGDDVTTANPLSTDTKSATTVANLANGGIVGEQEE